MKERILGLLLILVATLCAWIAFNPIQEIKGFLPGHKQSFSEKVAEDLFFMKKKKLLPKEWGSIQYVSYNFNSDLQRQLIKNEDFEIQHGPAGIYWLELELIDVPPSDETEEEALIIQMSLFEKNGGNKIWELGKTYSLKGYLQKNKSAENKKPD
jgi:hypothetical protein